MTRRCSTLQCRALRWPDIREADDEYVSDIYDSEQWAEFVNDPVLKNAEGSGLPVVALALIICGDGVAVYRGHHAKPHSIFPLAMCILNLPPWIRCKMGGTHLPTCIPGPNEPKDAQVYLDIPSDELAYLYEVGIPVFDHYRYTRCTRL